MWRNWNPLNPPINHQSSDEDNYESPPDEPNPNELVSPNRPHQSVSASPRALLRPDPPLVEEVLDQVDRRLRDLPTREQRAANRNAHRQAQEAAEAVAAEVRMVNYDEQVLARGEVEDDKALDNAIRAMQRLEFDEKDLQFFFQQAELKMKAAAIKAQYTKFQALTAILPRKVQEAVKSLLRKQENELGNTPYKSLKTKIFQIFGPPKNAAFERAMSRVLSDTPSQLCRSLIDDMCDHELVNCCCHKWIFGAWNRQLPTACRLAIADMEFNAANLEAILKAADSAYMANKPLASHSRIAAVSVVTPADTTPFDEAFHQEFDSEGQVAALSYRGFRGGRGGRGGRGSRGGRGQGGQGGQGGQNGQNRGQSNRGNGQNRGGNRGGGRGGGQGQGGHPWHQGPRHADGPPLEVCVKHWLHGKSAHWCQEPVTCPWRDYYIPRANNQ